VDHNTLLTGKTARYAAGGLAAALGLALMYPESFGIPLDTAMVLPGVPVDMLGGTVFALGIFVIAKAAQMD
jgi:hypothetical protein